MQLRARAVAAPPTMLTAISSCVLMAVTDGDAVL